jgi:hypothetical protein
MRISITVTLASVFLTAASLLSPSAAATDQIDPARVLNASPATTRATTGIAIAGMTVRDHRGTRGAPQGGVTVDHGKSKTKTVIHATGPLGGPKNKSGYAGLSGNNSGKGSNANGPTVRDHRK